MVVPFIGLFSISRIFQDAFQYFLLASVWLSISGVLYFIFEKVRNWGKWLTFNLCGFAISLFLPGLLYGAFIWDTVLFISLGSLFFLWHTSLIFHFTMLWGKLPGYPRNYDRFRNFIFLQILSIVEISIISGVFIYFRIVAFSMENAREIIISVFVFQIPSILLLRVLSDRFISPVKNYFRNDQHSSDSIMAFRRIQLIPWLSVILSLIYFISGTVIAVFTGTVIFSGPLHLLVGLFFFLFIVFLVSQLYSVIVLRKITTPILEKITVSEQLRHYSLRSPLSIRFKLGVWFGLLVFIGISFSAFWSYLQYDNLVSSFLGKRAVIRTKNFKRILDERLNATGGTDSMQHINRLIIEYSKEDDGFYYHLPISGRMFYPKKANVVYPGHEIRYMMRTKKSGVIAIRQRGLYGAFLQLYRDQEYLGSILILYSESSSFKAGNVSTVTKALIFFLILFGISIAGVAYFVNEFSIPLRRMEQHLAAITSGKMDEEIKPEGEADELGRLSLTLELMRKNIHEKIATIENLNTNLEGMVVLRTGELETANEELRKTLTELEKAQNQLVITGRLAALGKLLAGIAHEINNPVNAITNILGPLAEILEDSTRVSSEEDREDLKVMLKVLSGSSRKIRDVIDRITNTMAHKENPFYPVKIVDVISEVTGILGYRVGDVVINTEIPENAIIMAHKTPLVQVFENIVSNALHALENSSVKIINIVSEVTEDTVKVEVSDTGAGISPEVMEKIFDPFFTTRDVGKGMGLGLSIVHDIVNRYNGRIDVESTVGKGTRIQIVFQIEKV